MNWLLSAKELLKKWRSQEDYSVTTFTPRAQQTLALARKEAERLHHNYVGTEHILLALIALGREVAITVFLKIGLNLESLRAEIEKYAGDPADQMSGYYPYTPRAKRVLLMAVNDAKALNHINIDTEHLLLGLLREKEGLAADMFKKFNVNVEQARKAILNELNPHFVSDDNAQKIL